MPKELTFAVAMKDFFGLKEGETMAGFMGELKVLNPVDRAYFKDGLEATGLYKIVQTA